MLVLTRKLQETIQIGDDIKITVLRTKGNTVRIGIEAPNNIPVLRGELAERRAAENTHIESPSTGKGNGKTNSDAVSAEATRGQASRMPLSNPRQSLADPKPMSSEQALGVTHQKMSRSKVGSVLPQMLGESGPLRAMLDRRTQCVSGS